MAYTLKEHLTNRLNYGEKRDVSAIKYIAIHYTSNDGDTDENNGKYFANNVVQASAHYFVDSNSVTQCVPDDHVAWSVGGAKYGNCNTTGGGKHYGKCTNTNSISIEICDDVKNGVVYPSAKTVENAIELTKKKMKEYNIPASNVIRHFDVTGKSCPAYWVDDAKWKSEFWNKLTEVKTEVKTETVKVPFTIKVDKVAKNDVLNIRKTPNARGAITGSLKHDDPNTYTIIEVKNGWGKLKSGVGWINLTYTKTVIATAATPVKKEIKVGSTVRVKKGAKTFNGGSIASFVYEREHKVKTTNCDRVVITYNGTVVAAVRKSDLTVI